jgi:phage recombination protein Bet
MTTAIATAQPPKASILAKMAERFSVEPNRLLDTLKATAFKGQVSNEQMISLLIVADQYGLNPFTRELFAFPDKGGIVPVVSVDGWARIINGHPQFDGIQFDYEGDGASLSCTATIHRKDRTHPVSVTEYLSECKRDTQPWKSHPRRMLRHKAMIQCARLAFGFAGVFDEDEAHTIRDMGAADEVRPAANSLQAVRAVVAAKTQPTTVDMETGVISDAQPSGEASLLPAYLTKLAEADSAEGAALLLDEARDTLTPAEHKALADAFSERFPG